MRNPLDFRLVDLEIDIAGAAPIAAAAEPSAPPRVFARVITAPPGWPWEQQRGAMLEARHSAPLPIEQMQLRLRRLTPWRSRQPAQFAAIYVRAADVAARLESEVEVEGRLIAVVFEPPEALARRARRSLIAGLAVAGVAALLFVSIAGALLARAESEQQLATLERDAAMKLRRAEAVQAARRDSAALFLVEPGARVSVPLSDLAWAVAARDPDARIEAWRWDHGKVGVEARGEAPPFTDPRRVVSRSATVRPGVWLWQVAREETGP